MPEDRANEFGYFVRCARAKSALHYVHCVVSESCLSHINVESIVKQGDCCDSLNTQFPSMSRKSGDGISSTYKTGEASLFKGRDC